MFAIFIDHKPKDEILSAVLLMDGCWTLSSNCYHREFGVVWHKPRLFHTRGGAKNYKALHHDYDKGIRIGKYEGPTKPWEREESSSGPLGECKYNCTEAEHVGDGKYVCFKSDHWK